MSSKIIFAVNSSGSRTSNNCDSNTSSNLKNEQTMNCEETCALNSGCTHLTLVLQNGSPSSCYLKSGPEGPYNGVKNGLDKFRIYSCGYFPNKNVIKWTSGHWAFHFVQYSNAL